MAWLFTVAATSAGTDFLQAEASNSGSRAAAAYEKERYMTIPHCIRVQWRAGENRMRVGMIGTGAISHKHAQAYRDIGFELTVCTDINVASGRRFAGQYGVEFVESYEDVCRHPHVHYVDVCTFPAFRLEPLEPCAKAGKHVQVQKPIATNMETARA